MSLFLLNDGNTELALTNLVGDLLLADNSSVYVTKSIIWDVDARVSTTQQILFDVNDRVSVPKTILWNVNSNTPICLPFTQDTSVFKRVFVDYNVRGPSRVFWELNPRFNDTGDYSFQLQVGETGISDPSNWTNVGAPEINSFYASDTVRRLFGKVQTLAYRVILTTGVGTYVSAPAQITGNLNKHDWLIWREITRKELLRSNRYVAVKGYLLKVRRSGEICSCVDPITGESTNSQDPVCFGTGWVGGYWQAMSCTFMDLSPKKNNETRDLENRGMVNDVIVSARYIGYPLIHALDVFVAKNSDDHWIIHSVTDLCEVRGVPVVTQLELRLAPFSSVVYTVPIEGKNPVPV